MNKRKSPDDDCFDSHEVYSKKKLENSSEEEAPYFPIEESKPPHY